MNDLWKYCRNYKEEELAEDIAEIKNTLAKLGWFSIDGQIQMLPSREKHGHIQVEGQGTYFYDRERKVYKVVQVFKCICCRDFIYKPVTDKFTMSAFEWYKHKLLCDKCKENTNENEYILLQEYAYKYYTSQLSYFEYQTLVDNLVE